LGTGLRDGIALSDIEILNSNSGQPTIKLLGKANLLSKNMKIKSWHVSISHGEKSTIAFVIAESF
jgi:holo-[acyl-carrier-protein] synthase